ncbi:MAG TPA: metal ABC transporter permease [Termitinemataceae bacterium]|nr:metal ABC transporter permease [Termitinemataceae bacterium]HOM24031.1 metal ABC transporter permease [Termitinemataceae bacterium]HPQ00963.1 metal ABC transporter permease [Termitinemataceae bacterium]
MVQSFIATLFDPSIPFLRNALLAGVLAAILFGVLGTIVTVKRIAGLAGAISHAVLGGIGLALYLSATGLVPHFSPLMGALLFAVLSAVVIGLVSLTMKQREDTIINAIWAIGMSLGVLFMAKTPGYRDPASYLFGNILFITSQDLVLLALLDGLVIFLVWRYYPQLVATAFDEEFARVRGIPVQAIFLIILSIIAIAVVLLQTFVGVVMVIAMLTLPAGTASYFSKSLAGMMVGSVLYALVFSVMGLFLGWVFDLPGGAMVVVLAGVGYIMAGLIKHFRK